MLGQPEAATPAGYRPDIDGLRAVAVLLVVASHLGTRPTGGYIGVDVFFVISGYLISASILSEIRAGRFSITAFYERRIRRILPALLAMLFVVTLLSYHYLLPGEMIEYAHSLEAALVSGSNFQFWHEGSYFDLPSELKPLLHTWSLGVEEQFYILFPIFLLAMRGLQPKQLKAAIFAVAGLSFLAACFTVPRHSAAAFFFAPLRAWELLIGTIVSQRYLPMLRAQSARDLAAAIGFLLLIVPAFLYTPDTTFPGWTAVPPCLGTGLIIAAGETGTTMVGSLLSLTPVRFIGLISYSLYLWHWPIIVFVGAGGLLHHGSVWPPKLVKVVVAVVSIAVATLSWRYVEQPFREGRWRPGRGRLFALAGGSTALIALMGTAMLVGNGFPGRLPLNAQRISEYLAAPHAKRSGSVCFVQPANAFTDFDQQGCMRADDPRPHVLIAGDSHADMLTRALAQIFPERAILEASASDCAPLLATPAGRSHSRNCARLNDYLFREYLLHHPVSTLVLVARWRETDIPGLTATIEYLRAHGIRTIMIGPSVEYDTPAARLLAVGLWRGDVADVPKHQVEVPVVLDARLSGLAKSVWHIPYISIYADLCRGGCPLYAGGSAPLVYDGNHLSEAGGRLLAEVMRERHQLP